MKNVRRSFGAITKCRKNYCLIEKFSLKEEKNYPCSKGALGRGVRAAMAVLN